jgi:alpha-ketoglutarate-dependent taurine dioxygenase
MIDQAEISMCPTMPPNFTGELRERGFVLVRQAGHRLLIEAIEQMGRVIHVEEVVVSPGSSALLKSNQALALHTDHHRADIIVWHCISQTEAGGETVLVDGLAILATLSAEHRAALERIQLQEHGVFRGDADQHPVLWYRNGMPRLYYSSWLADDALAGFERTAFDAFEAAAASSPKHVVRLEAGDVLAIDNGRMLHGRTAIEGSMKRHLRRYWIEAGSTSGS